MKRPSFIARLPLFWRVVAVFGSTFLATQAGSVALNERSTPLLAAAVLAYVLAAWIVWSAIAYAIEALADNAPQEPPVDDQETNTQ